MVARAAMVHRTTVERDTPEGTDDWGQPIPGGWVAHLSNLACYGYEATGSSGAREVIDGDKTIVVNDRRVQVPSGTDVTEADRLTQVADRRGRVILDGPLRIDAVVVRKGHLMLAVERIG